MGLPREWFSKPRKGRCGCGQRSSSAHGSKMIKNSRRVRCRQQMDCSTVPCRINTALPGSEQEELNKSLPLPSQRQGWKGTPSQSAAPCSCPSRDCRVLQRLQGHQQPFPGPPGLSESRGGCSGMLRAHSAHDCLPARHSSGHIAYSPPLPWPPSSGEGHRVHC